MKTVLFRSAVVAAAACGMVMVATPAQAAADPALVSCSFAGVYDSYDGGSGTGLQGYAKRDDHLTVTGGNGSAWAVHVDDGFMAGADGWIEAGCVSFLA